MKIIIQSPVAHDGELLDVGQEADLPKDDAEALVRVGAAIVKPGKAPKAEADKAG